VRHAQVVEYIKYYISNKEGALKINKSIAKIFKILNLPYLLFRQLQHQLQHLHNQQLHQKLPQLLHQGKHQVLHHNKNLFQLKKHQLELTVQELKLAFQ
jgi:hypothetical protein